MAHQASGLVSSHLKPTSQTRFNELESVKLQPVFARLDALEQVTTARVLEAFTQYRVGEQHFYSVSGYAHDDMGREVTDKVFAHALQAQAALVRPHFVSGTHAIAMALRGLTQPGQQIVSITGAPYDTLEEVIGLRGNSSQSLKAWGVEFLITSVFDEQHPEQGMDCQRLDQSLLKKADVIYIQRSRGYAMRPALNVEDIGSMISYCRRIRPDVVVFVDNCYGEFTEENEPAAVGANLMAGSLIKNPGAGIVPTGGYIAGDTNWVERCAEALTAPGIGCEGGYTFHLTPAILQGLFMAPHAVVQSLKGMALAAAAFEQAGYLTTPQYNAVRSDIIQVLQMNNPDQQVRFCQVLQANSPIDSNVTPVPADIPGYADKVVMAGGTFVQGSTQELSADGPLREPYPVFLQGGLSYAHIKLVLGRVLDSLQV